MNTENDRERRLALFAGKVLVKCLESQISDLRYFADSYFQYFYTRGYAVKINEFGSLTFVDVSAIRWQSTSVDPRHVVKPFPEDISPAYVLDLRGDQPELAEVKVEDTAEESD